MSPHPLATGLDDPDDMRRAKARKPATWVAPVATFTLVFAGVSYGLAPQAPGKDAIRQEWTKRTTDQGYGGCSQARVNRHEDIQAWEPSYRSNMDGDGDGVACERRRR